MKPDIQYLIDKLLDAPLSNTRQIFPRSDSCSDAIQTQSGGKEHQKYFDTLAPAERRPTAIDGLIIRRLGHLVVNPTDPHNTQALNESYVYYSQQGNDEDWANYSPETADQFVNALIQTAKKERSRALASDAIYEVGERADDEELVEKSRLFILHGPRGCGKTIYINHLLSKYSAPLLDKTKVIWVRINLVEDFGDNEELMHWIGMQATKIIMRYYDPLSKEKKKGSNMDLSIAPHLASTVRSSNILDAQQKDDDLRKVVLAQSIFYDKANDEPIQPKLLPAYLTREAMSFALRQGYSFIVVLDGLDRLDVTGEARSKHMKLLRQVGSLRHKSDVIGLCLLVVTRNYHAELPQIQKQYHLQETLVKRLLPSNVAAITERRLVAIEREIQNLEKISQERKLEAVTRLKAFREFLRVHANGGSYLGALKEMFQTNLRAQMQILQMSYFEFLNETDQKRYQLIETVMRSGLSYPPLHYTFRVGRSRRSAKPTDLRITVSTNPEIPFDSRFCPSIFLYPVLFTEDEGDSDINASRLLMGIRLLQMLDAELFLRQTRVRNEPLEVSDIARLCSQAFLYSRNHILALIEVFAEFDLVRLSGRNTDGPTVLERHLIELLPKGEYLLKVFIYDIAYLNLCGMRVPLANEAFGPEGPPYFVASSFNRANLRSWVHAKFHNSISMIRLIKKLVADQERLVGRTLSSITDPWVLQIYNAARNRAGKEGRQEGLFSFIESLRGDVSNELRAVLISSQVEPRVTTEDEIYNALLKYAQRWTNLRDTDLRPQAPHGQATS